MKLYSIRTMVATLALGALFSGSAIMAGAKMEGKRNVESPEQAESRAVLPSPNVTDLNAFGVVKALGGVLTNEIDPVKKIKNPITGAPQLVPNECGTTCFSGNAAVHPYKKLLVNEINPVKLDPQDSARRKCIEDEKGITCFSGIVGANEINPHKMVDLVINGEVVIDPCTKKPVEICVPDDSCGATTSFSGDIKIRDKHIFGEVDGVTLSNQDKAILKFNFSNANAKAGAFVRIYFLGKDSGNNYDVFYRSKHYVHPAGSNLLSQTTLSAVNGSLAPVEASFIDLPSEVIVELEIDSGDNELRYEGCVHYEIIGCESLRSIECNPVVEL